MNTFSDTSVWKLCWAKIEGIGLRSFDFLRLFPIRLYRILKHFWYRLVDLFKRPAGFLNIQGHVHWITELFCLVLDLIGVGEVYETLADIIKFNSRPLSSEEHQLARKLFGKSINLRRIRVDEYAFLGPRSRKFAYVSFYTINSWGNLSESVLVHELVHIWQYAKLGSVYIPRSLRAQFSTAGYDYGGVTSLMKAMSSGGGLHHFNLEQQGDIVADYYRLSIGHDSRWGESGEEDLWIYEKMLGQIRNTEEGHNLVA